MSRKADTVVRLRQARDLASSVMRNRQGNAVARMKTCKRRRAWLRSEGVASRGWPLVVRTCGGQRLPAVRASYPFKLPVPGETAALPIDVAKWHPHTPRTVMSSTSTSPLGVTGIPPSSCEPEIRVKKIAHEHANGEHIRCAIK